MFANKISWLYLSTNGEHNNRSITYLLATTNQTRLHGSANWSCNNNTPFELSGCLFAMLGFQITRYLTRDAKKFTKRIFYYVRFRAHVYKTLFIFKFCDSISTLYTDICLQICASVQGCFRKVPLKLANVFKKYTWWWSILTLFPLIISTCTVNTFCFDVAADGSFRFIVNDVLTNTTLKALIGTIFHIFWELASFWRLHHIIWGSCEHLCNLRPTTIL